MKETIAPEKFIASTVNEAGGDAYRSSARHALAQYVSTSCLNGTFYSTATEQLETILRLAEQVKDPLYVAQVAVYAHRIAKMKESPAALCAWLAANHCDVLDRIFDQVIDNGDMLRKFCKHLRSGNFGRRCFGSKPKELVQRWFNNHSGSQIFRNSIGNSPSLGDVLKMTHPKPDSDEKAALFAYLIGAKQEGNVLSTEYVDRAGVKQVRQHSFDNLPEVVRSFETWKRDRTLPLPTINFQFLTNESLTQAQWKELALAMNWRTTKKNLNTLARHKVFEDNSIVETVATRLRDKKAIAEARVFPYEIMTACLATDQNTLPAAIRSALNDALEIATSNVPQFDGTVRVCMDVSGSMVQGRITGNRDDSLDNKYGRPSTMIRCVDVASLCAAVILRHNPTAKLICFANDVRPDLNLDLEAPIVNIAQQIAKSASGGTNCSAPLAKLNAEKDKADIVIFLSDYESWFDTNGQHRYSDPVKMMDEWVKYKKWNPEAKLVCMDFTPRGNAQVKERTDILQVGGFNDSVFGVVSRFNSWGWSNDHWVKEIESIVV